VDVATTSPQQVDGTAVARVIPITMATKPAAAVALQIFVSVVQVPTTELLLLVAAVEQVVKPATETKIGVAMVAV
jgi:hypothetical protein